MMRNSTLFSLLLLSFMGGAMPILQPVQALNTSPTSSTANTSATPPQLAQILYPPVNEHRLLRVVGNGQASQPADQAYLELHLSEASASDNTVTPVAHNVSSPVLPIALTEADMAPIIAALKKIGVADTEIKVQASRDSAGGGFPFPFPSPFKPVKTLIGVEVTQPKRDRIEQIITVARDKALETNRLTLKEAKIQYIVDNCERIEQDAYEAAVVNAQSRANAIAKATNAALHPIPSIAEPFYSAFIPDCSTTGNFPFEQRTSLYDPTEPIAVKVSRTIFVTFTFTDTK